MDDRPRLLDRTWVAEHPRHETCQVEPGDVSRSAAGGSMAGRARHSAVSFAGLDIASSPMPDAPAPMLCTLVDTAFDSPDWTFEPKFDGLRVLARFDGDELTLLSRNNKPQELALPRDRRGASQALRLPGDHRRRGGLPRRGREDRASASSSSGSTSTTPRRSAGGWHAHPAYPLPVRHPLSRPLRRDPAAAGPTPGTARRGCRLVRPHPPTESVPAKGIEAGGGPARRPRRGSSASGSTAPTSRAGAMPG